MWWPACGGTSFALWYALSPETGKAKFADMTVDMQPLWLIDELVQMHPVSGETRAVCRGR